MAPPLISGAGHWAQWRQAGGGGVVNRRPQGIPSDQVKAQRFGGREAEGVGAVVVWVVAIAGRGLGFARGAGDRSRVISGCWRLARVVLVLATAAAVGVEPPAPGDATEVVLDR